MSTRRSLALLVTVLALGGAAACGGDDDSTENEARSASADEVETPASGDPVEGIEGAEEALDSVGLDTKAYAIERAMGEDRVDRVEVDGDTIHVYLKASSFDPMMACMVTGGVLSEGEKAVMHLDGEATPCD